MNRQTDRHTDKAESRVAFMTEKLIQMHPPLIFLLFQLTDETTDVLSLIFI